MIGKLAGRVRSGPNCDMRSQMGHVRFTLPAQPVDATLCTDQLENTPTSRSLQKILSQQTIGLLIGPALSGTLRVAEVNIDVGR
jgi:hypothetical protein